MNGIEVTGTPARCGCGGNHAHGGEYGHGHTHGHVHEDSERCGETARDDSVHECRPGVEESACACGCEKADKPSYWASGLGVALAAAAMFITHETFSLALFLAAYLLVGYRPLLAAGKNILRGKVFDENFLMSVATIGAFAIGEYTEAIAVLLFYQVGEYFQDKAVGKSRRSIESLLSLKPDTATLLSGKAVPVEDVAVGDVIVVVPGARVPLDGVVVRGASALNNAALTGESMPVEVGEGDMVFSGGVNTGGVLEIRVEKEVSESTATKILDLVQNASHKKARTENFITRFSKVYTPIVCALAVLVAAVQILMGIPLKSAVYNALVFLVVSCPCALVISIPLGFFGGIGAASRKGVLFKGGNYLEALAKIDAVALDKTGTLTQGVMRVTNVISAGRSREELLALAAHAEAYSTHPIAEAITREYGRDITEARVADYEYVAGRGVKATIDGAGVLAGNAALLRENGVEPQEAQGAGTFVYLAADGVYLGAVEIADTLKDGAAEAISRLRAMGISRVAMLSGDAEQPARHIASQAGISEVYAKLLPQDKSAVLQSIIDDGASVAFVGDGINDSPVLALSHVGIAMGGIGSDAAIEASDVVIMNDDIGKVPEAVAIARQTKRIVYQNIALSMGIKVLVLGLSAVGLSTMWEAVIADVGVALLATLNAVRLARSKI